MNKQAGAIVVSILFAVGTTGASYVAGASEPQGSGVKKVALEGSSAIPATGLLPRMVTGELVKIDGLNYSVKDNSGKVVNFQIDQSRTMMNTHPVVGDKIMAEVEPQGYAYSINRVP
jgi:hypothetical protein